MPWSSFIRTINDLVARDSAGHIAGKTYITVGICLALDGGRDEKKPNERTTIINGNLTVILWFQGARHAHGGDQRGVAVEGHRETVAGKDPSEYVRVEVDNSLRNIRVFSERIRVNVSVTMCVALASSMENPGSSVPA